MKVKRCYSVLDPMVVHILFFNSNWISFYYWLQFINYQDVKTWKKKIKVKDLKGSARNVSDNRLVEENLLWKAVCLTQIPLFMQRAADPTADNVQN